MRRFFLHLPTKQWTTMIAFEVMPLKNGLTQITYYTHEHILNVFVLKIKMAFLLSIENTLYHLYISFKCTPSGGSSHVTHYIYHSPFTEHFNK